MKAFMPQEGGSVLKGKRLYTYKALRWCLRLWPLAILAVLLHPGLNPAAYLKQMDGWSYSYFLQNAMEVDKLFARAYPGVREMFAVNALLNFLSFATLACLFIQALGSLFSFLQRPKARKAGLLLSAVFGTAMGVLNLLILIRVSGANAAILRLSYDGLGMRYLYPAGAAVLTGLGFAELLLYLAYRRLRMKHESCISP